MCKLDEIRKRHSDDESWHVRYGVYTVTQQTHRDRACLLERLAAEKVIPGSAIINHDPLDRLDRFYLWCREIGHYQAFEAVERFLLAEEREDDQH